MKTLVRVQEHTRSSKSGYITKTIQILTKKFKDSDTLEPIGVIKFQKTVGEEGWYGMSYLIDTDDATYIQKMSRLVNFIKKNSSYSSQPEDILKVIGAVEYKIFQHEFVPISKNGQIMYDVIVYPGSLHSRIIAPDDKTAEKILKRKKLKDAFIKINCKVVLT
jgi:hypothetical protein